MAFEASDFRYTRSCAHKVLTPSQRYFYEKNGFLMLPKFMPQDILDACNQRYDDIVSKKVPAYGMTVMRDVEDRVSVYKLQDLLYDDVFHSYLTHPKLLDVVEGFVGPNILTIHHMMIGKPPDNGHGTTKHPPHQDLHYFPFRPADLIVAAWTAVDRCDRENGCLKVIPGTHTLGKVYPHTYPPGSSNKLYHGIQKLPVPENWVYFEMDPGDTVFFHPLLIHGADINRSNRSRKSLTSHYAAGECTYLESIENTVHKEVADEVTDMFKRHKGIDVTYIDLWRLKCSLVRGVRSTL